MEPTGEAEQIKSDEPDLGAILPSVDAADKTDENTDEQQTADVDKLAQLVPKNSKNKTKKHSIDKNLNVPIKSVISKENELCKLEAEIIITSGIKLNLNFKKVYLNGGILYYKPLEEGLNAFDSGLMIEKNIQQRKQPIMNAQIKEEQSQLEFDPDFIELKQFLNLISSFIQSDVLNSEKFVNDLIVFLKDNYGESQMEKNAKLDKVILFFIILFIC